MNRKLIASLGVAGALALGAVPALAQDDSSTATEATTTDTSREEARAARQAEFAQALADELGLPVEDVSAALTTVRDQVKAERDAERDAARQARLDEAVANGELTQEQADAIAAAADAGLFEGRGGRGHHGPRGGGFGGPGPDAPGEAADAA